MTGTLDIVDIRDRMPTRATRFAAGIRPATSATLHYNGPPVALHDNPRATREQWIAHFRGIANYHMAKVWGKDAHGRPLYGDAIMYAYAVIPDGTIFLLDDPTLMRFHCANGVGNARSIPVHLPLGGTQDATQVQWTRTGEIFDALIAEHAMPGREAIKGHREWLRGDGATQSPCPGPILTKRLTLWRDYVVPAYLQRYRVTVAVANVREGPGVSFPVAWQGNAKLPRGYEFDVDSFAHGDMVGGSTDWLHMAGGLGFVHSSLLERV